jgi:hypothetical protein
VAGIRRRTAGRLFPVALVALVGGAACGSSGSSASKSSVKPSAACVVSMKAFHDGLVSSDNNLTNPQRAAFEAATVNACTRAEWLTAVKGYTGNQITEIVVGTIKPTDILKSFCKSAKHAQACQ